MAHLAEKIDDVEELTNYVVESNKFRVDKLPSGGTRNVLHYRAFLPDKNRERSVFRMDGLDHSTVVEWGRVFVAQPRCKSILGWGRVPAGAVRRQLPLRVRSDEPPPRHAVIDQWPTEIEHARTLAMELASATVATKLP